MTPLDGQRSSLTCAQCGRAGTRDFKTLGGTAGIPLIVVCASRLACMKRWLKAVIEDA